jgi:hypothetical protein
MRILAVDTAQPPVQREQLPGIVGKRRSVTVAVTIALALSLCGTALTQTAAAMPERISDAVSQQQSGPMPERISDGLSQQQSGPLPERISDAPTAAVSADSDPVVAPAAAVAPNVSSDDGLGALVIVLISVGGAMALAGVAYAARRVMRHGHAAA